MLRSVVFPVLCPSTTKNVPKNYVLCAYHLILSGSDASSEGIYDFIVDIKFMMVSDCVCAHVPYLSTIGRDVPKE